MRTVSSLRRVVTGLNDQGKSIVAIDGPPSPYIEWDDVSGLFEIWTDHGSTEAYTIDSELRDDHVKLTPPKGGFKVRWFSVAPEDPKRSPGEARAAAASAFTAISAAGDQPDTSRHPAMHQTRTLDVIVLIRGSVRLLLDDDERVLSPGDVVIQRGTNHAWIAEGDEPAVLVAVLVDRKYES